MAVVMDGPPDLDAQLSQFQEEGRNGDAEMRRKEDPPPTIRRDGVLHVSQNGNGGYGGHAGRRKRGHSTFPFH